jgi:type IV pilus assembly protein PilM
MAKAWGIDIGRSAIKGVLLRKTSTGLELTKVDYEPLEVRPGASDAEKDAAMRNALSAFLSRNRIRGEKVFISIPGHTVFNRLLRVPPVEGKKLASSIRFEAQQQIPFPIEDVVWDYQKLPRDAASGDDWEVNLFAVKKDFIAKTLHNIGVVELEVDGIQVCPMALFNYFRYDRNLRGANVLIDMGADSTDLILIDADKTFIRNIPIAGNQITKHLEEKFKIPFAEAEKLKLKSTGTKQAQKIFKVMKPSLGEMTAEISRSMGYYTSQVPDVNFRDAFVIGNASQLVGLERFLSDALELKVRTVERFERISIAGTVDMEIFNDNFPAFIVALGLGIQALGEAEGDINLLPEPIARARAERRKRPWFIASAVVLLVTLLVVLLSKSSLREEYTQSLDRAGKVRDTYKDFSTRLKALGKNDDLLDHIATRSALVKDRAAVLKVYDDVMQLLYPPVEVDKKRPTLWLLRLEVSPLTAAEGATPPHGLSVQVLAAMENPRPDIENLTDVKKMARARVKEYVVKRIAGMDPRYANVKQDLEKMVASLDTELHAGKKYYRFRIGWDVTLEGGAR